MKYYIYKITSKIDGKIYVGQHKYKEKEFFREYMGSGSELLKDYKKYGQKQFDKEIIEWIEDDENRLLVYEREKYWIEKLKANVIGYNINPGGKNTCLPQTAKKVQETRRRNGYLHPSEHTKKLMSLAAKGKPKSEIHKKHLSDNHRTKKVHEIVFENGQDSVYTTESICNIAQNLNVDVTTLRRRSAKGLFCGGIKLPELFGKE